MFFHTMKYTLLNLLRDKGQVFWCVAFPLLLGTMFHFAFGGLGSGESFSAIPVAVVMQEESSELRSMIPCPNPAKISSLKLPMLPLRMPVNC